MNLQKFLFSISQFCRADCAKFWNGTTSAEYKSYYLQYHFLHLKSDAANYTFKSTYLDRKWIYVYIYIKYNL